MTKISKQCEMISDVNPTSEKNFTMLSNMQKQCEMISEVHDGQNEQHNVQKFSVMDKNHLRGRDRLKYKCGHLLRTIHSQVSWSNILNITKFVSDLLTLVRLYLNINR